MSISQLFKMAQSLLEYVHVAGGILSEGMMEPSGALGQSDRTEQAGAVRFG